MRWRAYQKILEHYCVICLRLYHLMWMWCMMVMIRVKFDLRCQMALSSSRCSCITTMMMTKVVHHSIVWHCVYQLRYDVRFDAYFVWQVNCDLVRIWRCEKCCDKYCMSIVLSNINLVKKRMVHDEPSEISFLWVWVSHCSIMMWCVSLSHIFYRNHDWVYPRGISRSRHRVSSLVSGV